VLHEGRSARGGETSKLTNRNSEPRVPKRSGRKRSTGIGQAQGHGKLAEKPRRDKGMERPKGQIARIQCGQLGTLVKPPH
jgi:hypothetical protein